MTALLEAEGLELAYGQVPACRDIAFHVEEGEVVTLIGANGAGKSTTLRSIQGINRPKRGSIRFNGADIVGHPPHEIVRPDRDPARGHEHVVLEPARERLPMRILIVGHHR